MATIDEVLNTYMQIDLVQIAKDLVNSDEQNILDINRNQLRIGFDSNGNPVRPKYTTAKYARFKQRLGSKAPIYTPDLLLTGNFYNSLKFDTGFKVESVGVPYSGYLESRYGKNIYGFNDKNLSAIQAKYVNEIKRKLGL
jgi:hypothetical protein